MQRLDELAPLVCWTCAETMASCSVILDRRSMLRALLCKIVILLVQEVSVSKLGLQLGGSEENTQLVSYKSPED
jgi:hypothetical protein